MLWIGLFGGYKFFLATNIGCHGATGCFIRKTDFLRNPVITSPNTVRFSFRLLRMKAYVNMNNFAARSCKVTTEGSEIKIFQCWVRKSKFKKSSSRKYETEKLCVVLTRISGLLAFREKKPHQNPFINFVENVKYIFKLK